MLDLTPMGLIETTGDQIGTSSVRGWGIEEAMRFQFSRHGPDGKIFLDPHISNFLKECQRPGLLLDVGTGAAAVPLEAALHYGVSRIHAVDNSPAMLKLAEKAIAEADMSERIFLEEEDAKSLRFKDGCFPRVASVNVGCNLDNETLAAHLHEMARVVSKEGRIFFAVPVNLGELFSNGEHVWVRENLKESRAAIKKEAASAAEEISQALVQKHLGGIGQIHRGTFIVRDGQLWPVINNGPRFLSGIPRYTTGDLQEGEEIFRKLPGLVVPNNYHSQTFYEQEINRAGLLIREKTISCFISGDDRIKYNLAIGNHPSESLGQEYVGKGPFAVFILTKA